MVRCVCLACTAFVAASLWQTAFAATEEAASQQRARDQRVLAESGIPPTPAGALAYLESLVPVGDPNAVIDALIVQLGDDQFERREQAALKLLSLPSLPRAKLETALQSDDAEIRWRSRMVLGRLGATGNRPIFAALREVAADPPSNTVDVLLRLAALESLEAQQLALQQTLFKVTNEDDIAQLKAATASGSSLSRVTAAAALQRLSDVPGRDALAELLNSKHPRAALLAAKHLGNTGDRRALAALGKLLTSEDLVVASESANFISALVGRDFGYPAYGDTAMREQAATEVQRWLAAEGANAPLTFPVAEPVIVRGDLAGNTLVAAGNLGYVVELDTKGIEVWRYPIVAWGAEKLPNGNVLIASYQSNQVLEINKHGTIVWNRTGLNAMRAKPLADGHILVADFGGHRVLELNEDHQDIWSVKTPDNCFDAERLPNGNTVFCCPNLVREVDSEGQTVRDLAIEGRANSIQVLANGRWLVANFGKGQVQEYDRDGKLVWTFAESNPCDAFRLRSGKTLVASNRRGIEIASDGKTIREIIPTQYGCVRQ